MGAPSTENSRAAASVELRPDPADDAGQRADLLDEAVGRDAFRHVRDEQILADLEAAVLLEVARHEVGRPGSHSGSQDEQLARAQVGEQVVQDRPDGPHVDLDVRAARGAQGEHDRIGERGVGGTCRELQRRAGQHLLGARLLEGHASGSHHRQTIGILVDAEHGRARVRETQGQGQAYPSEADDGDVEAHFGQEASGAMLGEARDRAPHAGQGSEVQRAPSIMPVTRPWIGFPRSDPLGSTPALTAIPASPRCGSA